MPQTFFPDTAAYSIDSIACSSTRHSSTILLSSTSTSRIRRKLMTTKKIVLMVGGVVVVLGFLVVCFVGAIVGFALYQVGNSEAAARAKAFLRSSEKLKMEI